VADEDDSGLAELHNDLDVFRCSLQRLLERFWPYTLSTAPEN
jgi:hypothetical protein